jgi:hypothetical protein
MRTETTPRHATPYVLQRPPSLPESIEPEISRCELLARNSDPDSEHDAALLIAALEDLETKRAAIEWLLDAQLLHVCLV